MFPNYRISQLTPGPVLFLPVSTPRDQNSFHTDDFTQFFFCTSGSITVTVDSDTFSVGELEAAFVLPGQVHGYVPSAGSKGWVVGLDPILVPSVQFALMRSMASLQLRQAVSIPERYRADVAGLLSTLEKAKEDDVGGGIALWLASSAVKLAFWGRAENEAADGGQYILFHNFVKMTESAAPAAVAWYAEELGVTPAELSAAVRRYAGTSVRGFITERILEKAKRLLFFTRAPVTEVSARLGMDNAAYFSRFFKRHVGMTPTEYRERFGSGRSL